MFVKRQSCHQFIIMEPTFISTIVCSGLLILLSLYFVIPLVHNLIHLNVPKRSKPLAVAAIAYALPLLPSVMALAFASTGNVDIALRTHIFTLGCLTFLDWVRYSVV